MHKKHQQTKNLHASKKITCKQKNYMQAKNVQVNLLPTFVFVARNHIHLQAKKWTCLLPLKSIWSCSKKNLNLNASLHDGEVDGGDVAKGELWICLQPRLLRITEPKKPEVFDNLGEEEGESLSQALDQLSL